MPGLRLIDGEQLARDYAAHPERTKQHLMESTSAREVRLADFSIRELAEAFLGREAVANMRPKSGSMRQVRSLMEADGVRYTDFSEIVGQLLYTEVMDAYESPEFVFTKEIEVKPSKLQDTEKVPGMSVLGDESEVVAEFDTYPSIGPSQDWIHVGPKVKRGCKVEVSKEAVLGDTTGELMDRCKQGGRTLGINLEKRIIDAIIDEGTQGTKSALAGGHRYHWRDTSYASFQDTSPWVNVVTSNGLVNHANLRSAWQALTDLRDPFTGEPIVLTPDALIVTTDNLWTAKNILRQVETRHDTNNSAGTANITMLFPNPVTDNIPNLKVLTSPWLDDRAATDTDWWLGSPRKMVRRYVIWDLLQEEAPTNNHDMFERDVVFKFKASLKDCVATVQPRAMIENRA